MTARRLLDHLRQVAAHLENNMADNVIRGTVRGYARGSTALQQDTLVAQENAIKREYDYRYAALGYAWGGVLVESGVPGGLALPETAQKALRDHVNAGKRHGR